MTWASSAPSFSYARAGERCLSLEAGGWIERSLSGAGDEACELPRIRESGAAGRVVEHTPRIRSRWHSL
jgi:hypothetical protein